MKLVEFLNDDTCQIFLAIIVGIVVCYFVFGSCGGSCSRRDGFSVGGPCVGMRIGGITGRESCAGIPESVCQHSNFPGCRWEDPPAPPPPPPAPTPPAPTPPPPANSGQSGQSGQTQMERDCEAYLATLSSDAGSPCEGVTLGEEGGLDSTPSCCDAVESTGGCNKDTLPDEITTRINQEIALCSNPSTDPRRSPPPPLTPPPPPTGPQNKYINILSNMASAVLDIAESALAVSSLSTDDSRFLNEMMTNPNPTKSNFQTVKSIAETNGIYFQILIHTNNDLSFQIDGIGSYKLQFCYPDYLSPNYPTTGTSLSIENFNRFTSSFGSLFGTFSRAPRDVKKDLYCGQNSMFAKYGDNEFEKYDPLLKMKSVTIMDEANQKYVNCGGADTIFPSSCPNIEGENDINELEKCDFHIRELRETLWTDPLDEFSIMYHNKDNILGNWAINSVKADFERYRELSQYNNNSNRITPVLRRNNHELIIRDLSIYDPDSDDSRFINTDIIMFRPVGTIPDYKPNYTTLHFDGENIINSNNYTNANDPNTLTYELGDERGISSHFKLSKVYGMSQTGDGNIYKSNKGGEDPSPSDNKYNYYMNLLFIQYLITKIYLGTHFYLPYDLNIYNKQPANPLESDPDNREDIPSITGQNEENTTNSLCARSGTDYLLLVYTNPPPPTANSPPPTANSPLPACNNGGSRTLSIGDGSTGNTWSSSLPQECIYAKDEDGRSERCANNCEGCYQVVNGVGHVCKDYSGKHKTRVCTPDYECQP